MSYERRVGRYLKKLFPDGVLFSGYWLLFSDEGDRHWAQPDHFILFEKKIMLFECKLTQTAHAWDQMNYLYGPLLEHLFQKETTRIQVCKNLRRGEKDKIVTAPLDLCTGVTWHYFGF